MGYVGGPATSPPPASQAAPTAPATTGSTYGFIVSDPNTDYTVTVTVQYQGGGEGSATLTSPRMRQREASQFSRLALKRSRRTQRREQSA